MKETYFSLLYIPQCFETEHVAVEWKGDLSIWIAAVVAWNDGDDAEARSDEKYESVILHEL